MPSATESARLKCEEVLGMPVTEVRQTDNPNVILAMTGANIGVWLNRVTWTETEPVTIGRAVVNVYAPRASQPQPKVEAVSVDEFTEVEPTVKAPATKKRKTTKK